MSVVARREREREERRSRILDAAERAFRAHGVEAVKMENVAEEAQLGKGTLYLYFRTKEALTLAVAVRHQRRLLALFEEEQARASDGLGLLRALLLAFARHMSAPPGHLKLAMARWVTGAPFDAESRGATEMRENIQRVFETVRGAVTRGQADGSIVVDVDPGQAAVTLWAAVNGALLMQLQQCCLPRVLPLQEYAPSLEAALDFYLRAVAVPSRAAAAPVLHVAGGAE